jgi:hypothetical protein
LPKRFCNETHALLSIAVVYAEEELRAHQVHRLWTSVAEFAEAVRFHENVDHVKVDAEVPVDVI